MITGGSELSLAVLATRRLMPAVLLALAAACDDAFRGGRTSGSGSSRALQVEFSFADGSDRNDLSENDTVELVVKIPEVGYRELVSPAAGTVDPKRLVVRSTPELRDASGAAVEGNLTRFFLEHGLLAVESPDDVGRTPIAIRIPIQGPLRFPLGLVVWEAFVTDDLDRMLDPLSLELTIRSLDRPTTVLRLEIPAGGDSLSGELLPVNSAGELFIGERLPFVLVVEGIPSPTSGAGFSQLLGPAGADPDVLSVVADRDLGDPLAGGAAAGENLAPLFATDLSPAVDPGTGVTTIAALFALDGPFSPAPGTTQFTVTLQDDEGVAALPQAIALAVEPAVPLGTRVQPIFAMNCAILPGSCHGSLPTIPDLVLLDRDRSHASLVSFPAAETPPGSCAPNRVEPYRPSLSYLVHKLLDTHTQGCVQGTGFMMPPLGQPLSPQDIQTIVDWIEQGAHNR